MTSPATSSAFLVTQIPKGSAGIDATLDIMRRVARRQAFFPEVRSVAVRLVEGVGPYNTRERAERILDWVRANFSFVPDPVGVEALTVPTAHLRSIAVHGSTSGDCDDVATLLATLARAVGLHARFVAASFLPTRRLHHVWTETYDQSGKSSFGKWIRLDPFRAETFDGNETARKEVTV
jgi:transglutaminase-like putative cysteine protease